MRRLVAALVVAGLVIGPALVQPAQANSDNVRNAVAIVIVQGVNTAQGNVKMAVQGTGFFISADGYLVTAYHLITKLTDQGVDPRSLEIQVHLPDGAVVPANAIPLYTGTLADVMVLATSLQGHSVRALQKADRNKVKIEIGKTDIFAAGYPSGIGFSMARGYIKSIEGPIQPLPLWTTSLTFKEGESGSPILLADDSVVAVAKADDADATQIGYVVPSRLIPSDYWDGGSVDLAAASAGQQLVVETYAVPQQAVARETQVLLTSQHCATPERRSAEIKASPGWRIVPNSVRLTPISSRGANSPASLDTATPDNIVVSAQLTNLGRCLLNGALAADVPAELRATVSYKETPKPQPQWLAVSSVNLAKSVKAPLPDVPFENLRFSVVGADGQTTAIVPDAADLAKTKTGLSLDTKALMNKFKAAVALDKVAK